MAINLPDFDPGGPFKGPRFDSGGPFMPGPKPPFRDFPRNPNPPFMPPPPDRHPDAKPIYLPDGKVVWTNPNAKPGPTQPSRAAPFMPDLSDLGPYEGKTEWDLKMPELNIPDYATAIPKMDQDVISGYKQEAAATGVRGLRNALMESLVAGRGAARDNPYAAQQQTKSALAGYGQGLGNVMTGAGQEAISRYAPEYQATTDAAQAEYQARVQGAMKEAELEMLPQIEQMKAEMAPYAKYLGLKSMAPILGALQDQWKKYVGGTTGSEGYYGQATPFNPFELFGYA